MKYCVGDKFIDPNGHIAWIRRIDHDNYNGYMYAWENEEGSIGTIGEYKFENMFTLYSKRLDDREELMNKILELENRIKLLEERLGND